VPFLPSDLIKETMAAPLKAEYPSVSEDFDSSAKIVNLSHLRSPKKKVRAGTGIGILWKH